MACVHQDYPGDELGAHDFERTDRENGRISFASVGESLRGAVGHGARAVARLGRSHNTLIRTLPIMDQYAPLRPCCHVCVCVCVCVAEAANEQYEQRLLTTDT